MPWRIFIFPKFENFKQRGGLGRKYEKGKLYFKFKGTLEFHKITHGDLKEHANKGIKVDISKPPEIVATGD